MVGVDTLYFLRRITSPYIKNGMQRWFYLFGINYNEQDFVYIFDPDANKAEYPIRFVGKSGMIDYVWHFSSIDEVVNHLKRVQAMNWYMSPAIYKDSRYYLDTFKGTFWSFADIDFKAHGINTMNKEKTINFTRSIAPKILKECDPDIIVFSGGGIHVYRQLDEFTTDVFDWFVKQYKLAECIKRVGLNPDERVLRNHINILRVPGTPNLKYHDRPMHRYVDLLFVKTEKGKILWDLVNSAKPPRGFNFGMYPDS